MIILMKTFIESHTFSHSFDLYSLVFLFYQLFPEICDFFIIFHNFAPKILKTRKKLIKITFSTINKLILTDYHQKTHLQDWAEIGP